MVWETGSMQEEEQREYEDQKAREMLEDKLRYSRSGRKSINWRKKFSIS